LKKLTKKLVTKKLVKRLIIKVIEIARVEELLSRMMERNPPGESRVRTLTYREVKKPEIEVSN